MQSLVPREKFKAINVYTKKRKKLQVNNLIFNIKKLEMMSKLNLKASIRKGITVIRVKIK